jgi:glycosyltransferase involved in cell wall biosynthesis
MSVVIAILAKNKEIFLPIFLNCLYNQTYKKKDMHLYIRTNDNTDKTTDILKQFIEKYGNEYGSVFYNEEDICENLKNYGEHEWNCERFRILGKIRQDSVEYAKTLNADYFVIDCDNFIMPNTLEKMYKLRELGVIAPMLRTNDSYSNFHYDVDANGYYAQHPEYLVLRYREKKGVYTVKVVHCVYFINNAILNDICYDDDSRRYEYVIFSASLRKKQIEQYLDNREDYGVISFSSTKEDLDAFLTNTGFTAFDLQNFL